MIGYGLAIAIVALAVVAASYAVFWKNPPD